MELTNEKVINAPRQRVFNALHDPQILRQAIPGCQALSPVAPDEHQMTVALKVGPLKSTFSGTVTIYNEDEPAGFSLRGQGHGPAGSAEGHAHVALAAIDASTTNLAYHISADLEGQLSTLEEAVVETAARTMAAEFFSRLALLLEGEAIVAERGAPMNVPVAPPPVTPVPSVPHEAEDEALAAEDTAPAAASTPVSDTVSASDEPSPGREKTTADVITVGGSRTDDLGVYRDTVPGAGSAAFDPHPDYALQGRRARPAVPDYPMSATTPFSGGDAAVGTMPIERDLSFGQYNRTQRADEDEQGPFFFIWRVFLVAVGLVLIYLLLTGGI